MSWTPLHKHVSQIHPNGSGQNDCFQASLARYLYESGKAPLTRDPLDLINEISQVSRGEPDHPGNPNTTLDEAAATLAHYGIQATWADSFQAAHAAPWSICLVDGTALRPAQYPSSWFPPGDGGRGNHFVLWLPAINGQDNWFNDPLAFFNGQRDCQYSLANLIGAFYGAYILPAPAVAPPDSGPVRVQITAQCALKPRADHTCPAIAALKPGDQCLDLTPKQRTVAYGTIWAHVQWSDKYGYVPADKLGPYPGPRTA